MLIGLDIDGVLAEWKRGFVSWYNATYQGNITLDDFNHGFVKEAVGVSEEEAHRLMDAFSAERLLFLEPITDSQLFVRESSHSFVAITRRPGRVADHTKQWLQEHYGVFDVHHTAFIDASQPVDERVTRIAKGDVCEELGVDVFVEDTPKHAEDVASRGVRSFIHHQPWNATHTSDHVERITSLLELHELL